MYEKEVTEIEHLIGSQNKWRDKCINLIASENVVSQRVRAQAGSDFAHRYPFGQRRLPHGSGKYGLFNRKGQTQNDCGR